MSFIELESVYKKYSMGEVTINALDGVSFSVEQGELCMVVGPSGAGKTTVLNILGGIDDCDDGKVRVGGELINQFNSKRMALYRRHDVGFVFQFYNLVPNLTALENVELASQISNKALNPVRVLERVGLADRMNNFPSQLPGGEQQRVAIARALVRKPEILILDDSASALDYATDAKLRMAIRNLDNAPTTFIVSQRAASVRYADKILVLDDGKLAGMGTHEQLLETCAVYQEIYHSQFPKEVAQR